MKNGDNCWFGFHKNENVVMFAVDVLDEGAVVRQFLQSCFSFFNFVQAGRDFSQIAVGAGIAPFFRRVALYGKQVLLSVMRDKYARHVLYVALRFCF